MLTITPKQKFTVVTITGPTCSGKSTLAAELAEHGIPEIRSFTTRAPRPGEVPGVHYDFMTHAEVEAIPEESLVERVVFNDNYYGNTIEQLLEQVEDCDGVCTVVVEPQGIHHWAAAAKRFGFNHFSIYLEQPLNTLVERFDATRGDSGPDTHKRRQKMIQEEHPTWRRAFDYELVIPNYGRNPIYSTVATRYLASYLLASFARTKVIEHDEF